MSSDLQALLAAIVADPSDDTARLVYADCLQEHGHDARAAFIRLQVEAEHLHPNSNARGTLEVQAGTLFEQNWIEWWGEVCAAVGLPGPELASYRTSGYAALVAEQPRGAQHDRHLRYPVMFRRGFPESVALPTISTGSELVGVYLKRWNTVSPLTELIAVPTRFDPCYSWPEGEHLRTVQKLALLGHTNSKLPDSALGSPNLNSLEHLTLSPHNHSGYCAPHTELTNVFATPLAPRLKGLSVVAGTEAVVRAIVGARTLGALEVLRLPIIDFSEPPAPGLVAELLGSPALPRLRNLALRFPLLGRPLTALFQSGDRNRLITLAINFLQSEQHSILRQTPGDATLEEVRLTGVRFTTEAVRDLVASPLLKRVKHVALSGRPYQNGHVFLPLVDAVEPDRIETFAIGVPHFPERAANALRAKFGDRVRFLTS